MEQHKELALNRRLVTLPEGSRNLAYGCSVCYWRFEPKVVSELYEAATLLSAQVLFGTHDCHKFKAPNASREQGDMLVPPKMKAKERLGNLELIPVSIRIDKHMS